MSGIFNLCRESYRYLQPEALKVFSKTISLSFQDTIYNLKMNWERCLTALCGEMFIFDPTLLVTI